MKDQVFISYRRNGGETLAQLIHDRLVDRAFHVFYDIESLKSGTFDTKLYEKIEECDDFILILSPMALDRCVNEDDWVRCEIKHALKHNKNIIPIFMRGFAFQNSLPDDIQPITKMNGVEFETMEYLNARIDKLVSMLSSTPDSHKIEKDASTEKRHRSEEIESLFKRATMFLEEKKWVEAHNYCERILDIEPENGEAYYLKFRAIHKILSDSDWQECYISPNDPLYHKILEFGDADLVEHVQSCYKTIASPFIMSGDTLIQFIYTGYDSEIIIPNTVKVIGKDVFKKNLHLTSVVIPDSVTRIEEHAFYECYNLKQVSFGNGLKYIGKSAFCECSSLTSISLPQSTMIIDDCAFWLCSNLENVTIENKNVRFINRPFDYCDKLQVINKGGITEKPQKFLEQKSGCYVATCVYGSYDCPQVWTLRRFRDDTLGATWYGRAFIRAYYAISPTLVKWFGKTSGFKRMWQGTLDKMVAGLNRNGVADTPYQDKNWR